MAPSRVRVNAGSIAAVAFDVTDGAGQPVAGPYSTCTLTLYDIGTYTGVLSESVSVQSVSHGGSLAAGTLGAGMAFGDEEVGDDAAGIINGWDGVSVLTNPAVTFDETADGDDQDGHVIWTMVGDDNVIVTPRREVERHRAVFAITWSGGSFVYEVEVDVRNIRGVSA